MPLWSKYHACPTTVPSQAASALFGKHHVCQARIWSNQTQAAILPYSEKRPMPMYHAHHTNISTPKETPTRWTIMICRVPLVCQCCVVGVAREINHMLTPVNRSFSFPLGTCSQSAINQCIAILWRSRTFFILLANDSWCFSQDKQTIRVYLPCTSALSGYIYFQCGGPAYIFEPSHCSLSSYVTCSVKFVRMWVGGLFSACLSEGC